MGDEEGPAWYFEAVETRLRDARLPESGLALAAWNALKGQALIEEQARRLWHFVGDLLNEHEAVVREECIAAIRNLGGIPGRD